MNKNNNNHKSHDSNYKNQRLLYNHYYDRETINTKALILIEGISKDEKRYQKYSVTPVDLCILMYDIDILDFFNLYDVAGLSKDMIDIEMSTWLNEKHFLPWVLTCASIDELLEKEKIIYDRKGSLILNKKRGNT